MKKSEKKEELQSRREFFKRAAKGALPILGAIVLSNAPIFVRAAESEGCTCGSSCTGTCDGCSGSCKGTCRGCYGCSGTCDGTCRGTCRASCANSCRRSSN